MERRAHLGHMEWQYDNGRGEVDATSPFAQLPQRNNTAQPPSSSSASSLSSAPNPFNASRQTVNAPRQTSPLRQSIPSAPSRSLFSPNLQRTSTGPAFRNPTFTFTNNPAFNTPQPRRFSEMDIDDSPAMTEASEVQDTPDADRSELLQDSPAMSTPEQPEHSTAVVRRSGKGPLPRATGLGFPNDRVRKRPRNSRDRDIAGTRARLPGGCDEDDSDEEPYESRRAGRNDGRHAGWLHYILSTVSSNPTAPIILSYYVQFLVNFFLCGLVLWAAWGMVTAVRGEVIYSSEKAKQNLLAEIEFCSKQYAANRCSPISERVPAVENMCNEWDQCMSQDPNSIAGVKASVSHLADIINEFTNRLSWKSILVMFLAAIGLMLVNKVAFNKFRENVQNFNEQAPGGPQPSHPAMGFPMTPHKSNQAYIWAPIGRTPKQLRNSFFQDDTDTDASPDPRLLPPPRTPSRKTPRIKREPSMSPSKRSPSKDW